MATTPKRKGLGRGLEALLGPTVATEDVAAPSGDVVTQLALEQLQAGQYQPRTRMDEGALYELAESIRTQGIMQPILVRPLAQAGQGTDDADSADTAATRYEIIAGERRFRAAKLAGLESVPVLVRQVPDQAAAIMALIENIQREDLNPLEEAQGLQRLVQEFGLTHEQTAQAVGRSRSAVSNHLRLLLLAEPVQTMLMAGDLDMGHARALLRLDKAEQITTAHQVASRHMTVRDAEALVRKLALPPDTHGAASARAAQKSGDVLRVEEELSDLLLAQVEVRVKKRVKRHGKLQAAGELSIQFSSMDELNGLIERLRGSFA